MLRFCARVERPICWDPKTRNGRHGVDFLAVGGWHCVGSGAVVLALASAALFLADPYSRIVDRVDVPA